MCMIFIYIKPHTDFANVIWNLISKCIYYLLVTCIKENIIYEAQFCAQTHVQ